MTTILQMSDTHFGTEVAPVVAAAERFIAQTRPDALLLTGDVTQRARRGQFSAARDFLRKTGIGAQLVIPGNHDIPLYNVLARALAPYGGYKKAFGAREGLLEGRDFVAVGFDATHPLRHTRGLLDAGRARPRLRAARAVAGDDRLLLACVHQPIVTALPQDAREALIDSAEAAAVLSEEGVDVVLSGHVHFPLVCPTQSLFPALPRSFIHCGAGTALSYRVRSGAPNSMNLLDISRADGQWQLCITLCVYEAASASFVRDAVHSYRLAAGGWEENPLAPSAPQVSR